MRSATRSRSAMTEAGRWRSASSTDRWTARRDGRATDLAALGHEGPSRYYAPELDMLLWEFPHDPRMKGLADLLDEAMMANLLRRQPVRFGVSVSATVEKSSASLVRYHPESRCVLEHRLTVRDVGGDIELRFFSKTFAKRDGAAIYDAMEQLWHGMSRYGTPGIPEPLHYDAERGTMFLSALEGAPAVDLIPDERMPEIAADIGKLMSSFHRSPVAGLTPRTLADDLRTAQRGPKALRARSDEWGDRGDALLPPSSSRGRPMRAGFPPHLFTARSG